MVLSVGRSQYPQLGGFGYCFLQAVPIQFRPFSHAYPIQGMSMGTGEGFKDYAQKWRDLAGRVQPPLADRELVDMFLGTLSGPFFNHLIESSSSGFTELIMTGERIEAGIKAGKI